jgi:malate dehydrogenase (oxaloacetate-decarboxylating)
VACNHTGLVAEAVRGRGDGRIHVLDSRGLLVEGRARIEDYKRPFTHPRAVVPWAAVGDRAPGLLEVVERTGATVLLGCSGQPGSFDETIVRAMCAKAPPLIFPPDDARRGAEISLWSGRAVVATGPFPTCGSGQDVRQIGQGNNAFIFPGVGLGASRCAPVR